MLEICSTQRSPVHRVKMHGASNRDTHLYPPHNISSAYLKTCGAVGGLPIEYGVDGEPYITPHFHPWHRHPPWGVTLLRRTWVRLNVLHTKVERFHSCLYKWDMASSSACEWGAEEQTVDHVIFQCPIHRPPHGRFWMHGLAVLGDETME